MKTKCVRLLMAATVLIAVAACDKTGGPSVMADIPPDIPADAAVDGQAPAPIARPSPFTISIPFDLRRLADLCPRMKDGDRGLQLFARPAAGQSPDEEFVFIGWRHKKDGTQFVQGRMSSNWTVECQSSDRPDGFTEPADAFADVPLLPPPPR